MLNNLFKNIDKLFATLRYPLNNINWKIFVFIIIFSLGLLFVITNEQKPLFEPFSLNNKCPNILIQKGKNIHLFNSRLAKIPGRNPIRFNDLEEYVEYTKWQRSQNIHCPILFLQHSYDAQGNVVYKNRPSPTELHGGLPPTAPLGQPHSMKSKLMDANRANPPFNKNLYPGFDPQNQYIGLKTPLDRMFHDNVDPTSANPMDSNWGGQGYTQSLIDQGVYKDNEVKIQVA